MTTGQKPLTLVLQQGKAMEGARSEREKRNKPTPFYETALQGQIKAAG